MLNYMFKNLPAEYVFAGYNVRKGISVMTNTINGQVYYDVFLFTYIDDYLSFYILMEDGKYKNIAENIKVDVVDGEKLISKHLDRVQEFNLSNYENYDKNKIYGVYGLRSIDELLKMEEEVTKNDNDKDISVSVLIGQKKAYTGLEISGIIKRFNQFHKSDKKMLTIPAIKKDATDSYNSVFGEELDFYDFISNKDYDEVVQSIKDINNKGDSLGNIK